MIEIHQINREIEPNQVSICLVAFNRPNVEKHPSIFLQSIHRSKTLCHNLLPSNANTVTLKQVVELQLQPIKLVI